MWTKHQLLLCSLSLCLVLAAGQEIPAPDFNNPYEPKTNKTIDELITETMGGLDVAANMMLSPGSHVLAELDMYLTNEQFLNLYQPPSAEEMIDMGIMPAPIGTAFDEGEKNFHDAAKVKADKRRTKRKAVRDTSLRWPKGVMHYFFAQGDFRLKEEYMMRRAMTEWERYTCVTFRPATEDQENIVRFQNGVGCNSQLGMVGGVQALNLEDGGCRYKGLYLHEIGHALGVVHEHQLPNRDKYITINYDNVSPEMKIWFNKYTTKKVDQMNVPYELSSVMHYGITAFSKDSKSQTIHAKDKSKEHTIGRVYLKELAYTDVMIVNAMYECSSHCPNPKKCGSEGHVDQYCNCICRDGSQDCDSTKSNGVDSSCKNLYNSWSCYIWANQGECQNNPGYMNKNCAKACGICGKKDQSGACKDGHSQTNCEMWKSRGDCITNSIWMEEHCKATCDFCDGIDAVKNSTNCKNVHTESGKCEKWAKTGECQVNKKWMNKNCAQACRVCDDKGTDEDGDEDDLKCMDKHNSCPTWSKSGECKTNHKWMISNCRKSCQKCQDNTCKNLYDDTQCQTWEQKNFCVSSSKWMNLHCAKSCLTGLCKDEKPQATKTPTGTTPKRGTTTTTGATCKNRHVSDTECDAWAKNDHCNINPSWMGKYCAKSCGKCKTVEIDRTTTSTSTTTDAGTNKCEDTNASCAMWAKNGYCQSAPGYNLIFCKKSCNNCNGCRDVNALCRVWAKAGSCQGNAHYMLRHCQKSCETCSK